MRVIAHQLFPSSSAETEVLTQGRFPWRAVINTQRLTVKSRAFILRLSVVSIMSTMIAALTIALLALSDVRAIRIPMAKRLYGRGTTGNNAVPVSNVGNAIYAANVTVGGNTFEVQIDTGRYLLYYSS